MTSDEPGISVSAPATRPPVQDSAVAIVSLRIRQRSSSERDRARASLPLMSVAPDLVVPIRVIRSRTTPGQPDRGAGRCRDAFLAAGETKPLAGGRLDGDARDIQPGNLGDPCSHGIAKRPDFRPLAD